jgi:radical SAM protein with 4Fe4S-binding SPASM domain
MQKFSLNRVLIRKIQRVAKRKLSALAGRFYSLDKTLGAMTLRPFELHLELTNLCNADCIFCPYQFQERPTEVMSDAIFRKAVADYIAAGGGSVGLTPIVGDALIDPHFPDRLRYLRSFPQIDRIWLTTNAILLDRFGAANVLDAGVTAITISTAGFDEAMYKRVYRSSSYQRMRRNVLELFQVNAARKSPIPISIALRPDRPLDDVLADPDFQPILAFKPELDFTWAYTSVNGRLRRENLPALMQIRAVKSAKRQPCVQLFNGPIVLSNGTVLACSCVASMDAMTDLGIGNIQNSTLSEIWTGARMQEIRASFADGTLNKTCAGCDMYRDPELYRTPEGRERARINKARHAGETVHRVGAEGPFSGG